MTPKLISIVVAIAFCSPGHSEEPNNAIDWFQEEPNKNQETIITKIGNKENIEVSIAKSTLDPNNLNSVGIISTQITGIDSRIWKETNEKELFHLLTTLPNLNFYSARTFLKRILISETLPPISHSGLKSGQFYLLAKLDKLIEMGALDEAETTILQVQQFSTELFSRWVRIAFLTGRISKLCKKLKKEPGLSQNLSVRVICLKKLNDWDAAALTLSTASNLELIDRDREKLLVYFLDPTLIPVDELILNVTKFDEIDFYILILANQIKTKLQTTESKYLYVMFKNSFNTKTKIEAAELLAISKSISGSTLFDIYRNNNINGSTGIWKRMIAIKNLDLTLRRNNEKGVIIALNNAVNEMFFGNLLPLFAAEYSDKLSRYSPKTNREGLNDYFALLFALNGEMPTSWERYQSTNKFIAKAISILRDDELNSVDIGDALKLVDPSFDSAMVLDSVTKPGLNLHENKTNHNGTLILQALKKSALGVNTPTTDLYTSLLLFLEAKKKVLVKSILIEYLIYFSRVRE